MSTERLHFIGVGGVGMSGIAHVAHDQGMVVTGSDIKESRYTKQLKSYGIPVAIGQAAENVPEGDDVTVVISTAILDNNPELEEARRRNLNVIHRAQMLARLGERLDTLAVAGTHGKTTTSSMVATMMDRLGMDPSFLIGGVVEGYDTNGRNGDGGYFVCEADESDGSFLYLNPNVVVVTNIEADHLDHYGTLENIEKTFCKFMDLVGEDGTVVIFGDNPHYVELARSTGRHVVTYGFGESADFRCVPVEASGSHRLASTFDVVCPGGHTVRVTIKANPGRHNMANATAAIAVADAVGADLDAAAAALSEFKGARRRFTHVADIDGVTVVDDYGHHPTEVAATLGAASELGFDRIVCVFQPHRYSRTQSLAADFGRAFDAADVLRVMDVFSAGEQPIPGVSGKTVVNSVREHDASKDVEYVPNRHELVDALVELVRPGDLLITQGAGDVTTIGPAFVEAMRARDAKRA